MNIGAIRVFVAAPKTAAYPSAEKSITGIPKIGPSIAPNVVPMINRGVTSPPC